jgi:hypothetical protein
LGAGLLARHISIATASNRTGHPLEMPFPQKVLGRPQQNTV